MKDSKLADNAYKVLKEELILGKFLPGDKMTETAIKFNEKLARKGKRLNDLSPEEFRDMMHEASE